MDKYIANKTFKVQGADGNIRMVRPGELVPEAAGWKSVEMYLKRKWLRLEGDGPAPAPKTAAKPQPKPKPETKLVPAPEDDSISEKELNSMTKRELKELASDLGIDTNQNKASLVAALLKAD